MGCITDYNANALSSISDADVFVSARSTAVGRTTEDKSISHLIATGIVYTEISLYSENFITIRLRKHKK